MKSVIFLTRPHRRHRPEAVQQARELPCARWHSVARYLAGLAHRKLAALRVGTAPTSPLAAFKHPDCVPDPELTPNLLRSHWPACSRNGTRACVPRRGRNSGRPFQIVPCQPRPRWKKPADWPWNLLRRIAQASPARKLMRLYPVGGAPWRRPARSFVPGEVPETEVWTRDHRSILSRCLFILPIPLEFGHTCKEARVKRRTEICELAFRFDRDGVDKGIVSDRGEVYL